MARRCPGKRCGRTGTGADPRSSIRRRSAIARYALKMADGETAWKAELKFNPWGGATVAGDLVIVPGSSIGYYYKELKGAKGDITAFDLKTGEQRWRKEIPTGAYSVVRL